MSFCDGIDCTFLFRKMEVTRYMEEEMDGKVFVSRQSWHFSSVNNMVKVLLPICTLNWRVDIYDSRQGNGLYSRNESTIIINVNYSFYSVAFFLLTVCTG